MLSANSVGNAGYADYVANEDEKEIDERAHWLDQAADKLPETAPTLAGAAPAEKFDLPAAAPSKESTTDERGPSGPSGRGPSGPSGRGPSGPDLPTQSPDRESTQSAGYPKPLPTEESTYTSRSSKETAEIMRELNNSMRDTLSQGSESRTRVRNNMAKDVPNATHHDINRSLARAEADGRTVGIPGDKLADPRATARDLSRPRSDVVSGHANKDTVAGWDAYDKRQADRGNPRRKQGVNKAKADYTQAKSNLALADKDQKVAERENAETRINPKATEADVKNSDTKLRQANSEKAHATREVTRTQRALSKAVNERDGIAPPADQYTHIRNDAEARKWLNDQSKGDAWRAKQGTRADWQDKQKNGLQKHASKAMKRASWNAKHGKVGAAAAAGVAALGAWAVGSASKALSDAVNNAWADRNAPDRWKNPDQYQHNHIGKGVSDEMRNAVEKRLTQTGGTASYDSESSQKRYGDIYKDISDSSTKTEKVPHDAKGVGKAYEDKGEKNWESKNDTRQRGIGEQTKDLGKQAATAIGKSLGDAAKKVGSAIADKLTKTFGRQDEKALSPEDAGKYADTKSVAHNGDTYQKASGRQDTNGDSWKQDYSQSSTENATKLDNQDKSAGRDERANGNQESMGNSHRDAANDSGRESDVKGQETKGNTSREFNSEATKEHKGSEATKPDSKGQEATPEKESNGTEAKGKEATKPEAESSEASKEIKGKEATKPVSRSESDQGSTEKTAQPATEAKGQDSETKGSQEKQAGTESKAKGEPVAIPETKATAKQEFNEAPEKGQKETRKPASKSASDQEKADAFEAGYRQAQKDQAGEYEKAKQEQKGDFKAQQPGEKEFHKAVEQYEKEVAKGDKMEDYKKELSKRTPEQQEDISRKARGEDPLERPKQQDKDKSEEREEPQRARGGR